MYQPKSKGNQNETRIVVNEFKKKIKIKIEPPFRMYGDALT